MLKIFLIENDHKFLQFFKVEKVVLEKRTYFIAETFKDLQSAESAIKMR